MTEVRSRQLAAERREEGASEDNLPRYESIRVDCVDVARLVRGRIACFRGGPPRRRSHDCGTEGRDCPNCQSLRRHADSLRNEDSRSDDASAAYGGAAGLPNRRDNEAVGTTRRQRGELNMYQIYSLLGLMVMTWGIAIWASLPAEQDESGD